MFSVVPLHGLGTTVTLILHGDPHAGTVSHLSQWSVYTRERDACNSCKKAFEQELNGEPRACNRYLNYLWRFPPLEKSLQWFSNLRESGGHAVNVRA